MHELVALDLAPGPGFVVQLQAAWAAGDAVLPIDQRLPHAAKLELVDAMQATVIVTALETVARLGHPVEAGDALVVATSGTTGTPKGVVLTHAAVEASARITSTALTIDASGDHWLCCLPVAHIGGLSVITRALHTGTDLTVLERFDPDAVAAAVDDGVTVASLVVAALNRVDPARFRAILLGGSAIPSDRPPNTVATYGMTETGSGVVYDGWPLQEVALRTVDGELQIQSPTLLRCYRDGSDPRTADGWFPTGDAGSIDAAGEVRVQGRIAEVIVTGGENVWPVAVENALATLPWVAAAAVLGRPSDTWGSQVCAVIELEPGHAAVSLDACRDQLRGLLPNYALPRQLDIVDALPRTALGKVRKTRL